MNIEQYISFVVIITVLLLSPGPSVLLSINNGVNHGLKLATFGVLGNVMAFQLLVIVSATGLGALILTISELLLIIKVIGAVYLCYLGIKVYTSPVSLSSAGCCETSVQKPSLIFKQAFIVTSSNPKALIFVSALLPQFIDQNQSLIPQVAAICLISAMIHFTIYFGYAALSSKAKLILNDHKRRQQFNQLSGVIFLLFGISLALSGVMT